MLNGWAFIGTLELSGEIQVLGYNAVVFSSNVFECRDMCCSKCRSIVNQNDIPVALKVHRLAFVSCFVLNTTLIGIDALGHIF